MYRLLGVCVSCRVSTCASCRCRPRGSLPTTPSSTRLRSHSSLFAQVRHSRHCMLRLRCDIKDKVYGYSERPLLGSVCVLPRTFASKSSSKPRNCCTSMKAFPSTLLDRSDSYCALPCTFIYKPWNERRELFQLHSLSAVYCV